MANSASKKRVARSKKANPDKKKGTNKDGLLTVYEQREIAKAGMVSSLCALFVTGFFRFQGARLLHFGAGWALLGFSLWHHFVSRPSAKIASE